MTDRDVDKALERAGQTPHEVDPALLAAIADSIKSSMRPVRALPPTWMLCGAVILISAAIAIASAALAGFHGFEKLDLLQSALIFSALGIFIWAAAQEFINQMIPGSRHHLTPGPLMLTTTVALLGVFAVLFRDYRTTHFLSAGIACLLTGLLFAVPTGLASWWVLRRGFAVNSIGAGLAGGTLGGLAGVTMLELHCDNFQAFHVILWHTAVVPLSGAAGVLLAWALRFRGGFGAGSTPV